MKTYSETKSKRNSRLGQFVGVIIIALALGIGAKHGSTFAAAPDELGRVQGQQRIAPVQPKAASTTSGLLSGDWARTFPFLAPAAPTLPPYIVNTVANSGAGSLRGGILAVNAGTADTIQFNGLPAGVVHTINLTSPLPAITRPVVIDGITGTGATCNTLDLAHGDDANLLIVLNGTGTPAGSYGLDLSGGNSTVKGMVINGFPVAGIRLRSLGSNLVTCNFLGTDQTGSTAVPNIGFGIEVNSSNNNLIGGTTPGSRNLISGNRQNGIIFSGASSGNTVQGNYVGTDRNGMAAVSNTNFGILVLDSSNNLIGGSAPAAGNLISGNYGGVWILSVNGSATGNWVKGNIIGPKRNGAPLASYMSYQTYSGVDIGMSSDNLIGGALGEGNVIAYNGGDGVLMSGCSTPALRNAVRRNSIYSNGKLGIELGNTLPNGVNPNDLNDTDGGHNTLQNYPILTSVSSSGTILGTLNSTANHTFEIDFFASFACDPSHYGEGQRYLGSISVVTDSTNNIPTPGYFTANFGALPSGWFITSTATDITSGGNTSEFSLCKPVPMAPPDPIYTGTVEPFLTFVPTPTLTASPIYSPTGTPVIRALLYGHVRWQGIPQPDSRNNGLGVSLTLCNANAEDTVIFATDESGVFSTTTDLPDGSYNWQLQSQKYLSGGGTIAGGTALVISNRFATVDAGTQPAGDANDDDVISITDFTNVKSSFGGSSNTCDSPFDYHADFNNDLIVNVLDFNLLKGNFGTGGAALTCP